LRGEKFSLFEGGIRVPAILSWPAGIPSHRKFTAPAVSMDIAPTVLAFAGVPFDPAGFDGVSLEVPFKTGNRIPDRTLFWEQGEQLAVRDGKWKLVINGQTQAKPTPPKLFLVDMENDPQELNNAADSNPHVVDDLRQKATQWHADIKSLWEKRQKLSENLPQDD
jgi:arylsulfatase A-like enzyme